jgi:DNA-binding NtrC family response regulator
MSEVTRTVVVGPETDALRMRAFALEWDRRSQEFHSRKIRIGSDPRSDFVVDAPSVSRTHCLIEVDTLGYRVEDLDSKNGTRIDGVRIDSAYLEPGATLALGEERVSFDMIEEEVEIPFSRRARFGKLYGRSPEMREVFGLLEKVAPSNSTVLIEGESGTGKELAAEALHEASDRSGGPFIVFDCSAVSSDIIESELFGHIKGAFTGATSDREGAFEHAAGGTLFIDEIGELSADLQPKLLRALESRTIRRVGTNEQVPVDARIIAATNRRLDKEVELQNFREDLYYRLAVIRVHLPPLRERPEDIPVLVRYFLDEVGSEGKKLNVGFETMETLRQYEWPGNVRELRNYIERAALLAQGSELNTEYLDMQPRKREKPSTGEVENVFDALGVGTDMPFKEAKEHLVEQFEKDYWKRALDKHDGNLSAAARAAGIHRKSAEYIVKKLGLRS